jgi:hypothetical protein
VGLAATTLDVRRTGSYERHRPETTTLYAVVRDNVETLYAAVPVGFAGAALPPFVSSRKLPPASSSRLKVDANTLVWPPRPAS